MNCNEYQVTMSYKELEKWQKIEEELINLKEKIKKCYEPQNNNIVMVDITELKLIGKSLLADRYQNCNYVEVR
jgi:hypothetical protein